MKVGCCVMAMRERESNVQEILAALDAPATVVWDEKRDRYDTGRRALLAHREFPDVTHWLVLQDDAIVCRDLVASVTKAVEHIPDNPISLYYGHGTNAAHVRTNAMAASAPRPGLLRFEGPWWGVAVCFPVSLIEAILAHSDRRQASPAYDKRLSRALQKLHVDTYYILPSLVDHRLDGPSMIPGRTQDDRHAHHFIGKDASALDIDWPSLPVTDGHRTRNTVRGSTRPVVPPAPPLPMTPRPSEGEPKLSVSIMAHPKRREMAEELGTRFGAQVVYDTSNDRWDTGRRSWLAHDPTATHHVTLQDDCVAPDDLLEGLTEALRVIGDNPVGLYLGTVRPAGQYMAAMLAHARTSGASWVVGEGPWWGVGVCLPVHMIAPMLAWCDRKVQIAAYDRRMSAYFHQAGIACWYTVPSLVDHREGESLVQKGRSQARRARYYVGDSAVGIDWTKLPSDTGTYVTYSGPAGRRFFRCLSCGYYTPMKHQITRHVRECPDAQARMVHA